MPRARANSNVWLDLTLTWLDSSLGLACGAQDDFLALTYAAHEAQPGVARPDLDALFAHAPRLTMLAVRPSLCRERRGISATENSPLITDDAGAKPTRAR